MCEELKLIQTHLGNFWKLEDWPISVCSTQLSGKLGIYCIKNVENNKLLIGEGTISARINIHIGGRSKNKIWKEDVKKYGQDNFRLIWIIPKDDEIQRKLIENKLQIHFKDNSYNRPRVEYPTQQELINHSAKYGSSESIIERLNNYTITNGCWESNYEKTGRYGGIWLDGIRRMHHVLMYILHYGDICGISSTVHHKCENKRCVNPKHLELTTGKKNTMLHYDTNSKIEDINKLYAEGKAPKEIAKLLEISRATVRRHIDFKTSSKYLGVSWNPKRIAYEATISIDKKYYHLGLYKNEVDASKNRDYYIVKNNLWHNRQSTLNFHDIDYNNYIPKPARDGKINKNLL